MGRAGGRPPSPALFTVRNQMALEVCEIFYSIQGESTRAGEPCIFIRLTGCNLRCAYCDTGYALEPGALMEIPEILRRVRGLRCDLVEVTGGEPLIQPETPSLIDGLLDAGHTVLLETNGSMDIGVVDPGCVRIVDIKCPSSGMAGQNYLENLIRNRKSRRLRIRAERSFHLPCRSMQDKLLSRIRIDRTTVPCRMDSRRPPSRTAQPTAS
jgi:pyruvate-formate lyase-activating enzyme